MYYNISLYNKMLGELTHGLYEGPFYSFVGGAEIVERDGVEILTLPLPGYKQADLEVLFENGVLRIKAKHKNGRGHDYSVTLGQGYDAEKMDAKIEDGILEVKLAKKEKPGSRKIPVR